MPETTIGHKSSSLIVLPSWLAVYPIKVSIVTVPGTPTPLHLPELGTGLASVFRLSLHGPHSESLPYATGLTARRPTTPLAHSTVSGLSWNRETSSVSSSSFEGDFQLAECGLQSCTWKQTGVPHSDEVAPMHYELKLIIFGQNLPTL